MFLFFLWKRWVSPPPWLKFSVPILNSSFSIEMGGIFFWKTNQNILLRKIFPMFCQDVFGSFSHYMVATFWLPCPKSSCILGMCHNYMLLVISLAKICHPQAEELFLWAEPVKKMCSWEHFSFWWIFSYSSCLALPCGERTAIGNNFHHSDKPSNLLLC